MKIGMDTKSGMLYPIMVGYGRFCGQKCLQAGLTFLNSAVKLDFLDSKWLRKRVFGLKISIEPWSFNFFWVAILIVIFGVAYPPPRGPDWLSFNMHRNIFN